MEAELHKTPTLILPRRWQQFKMTEYDKLNIELRKAGVPDQIFMGNRGEPIDTLVNTKTSSYPYLDLLISYLPKLSKDGNRQEMVVRALTEKKNKKAATHLIKIFKNRGGLTEHNLWAVGNALYTIDDRNTYPEIIELCKDETLGIGRSKLMGILARVRTEEAFNILVNSLSDSNVKGEAIEALGRFGDPRAIEILENTQVEKNMYEYKAKKTALKRLIEKQKKTAANTRL